MFYSYGDRVGVNREVEGRDEFEVSVFESVGFFFLRVFRRFNRLL